MKMPVTIAGLKETMYGKLCTPAGGSKAVQILVPGASYNSTYWDSPYTPETRSFRLAMNKAGYATLAIDRLGTGRSSIPPSAVLTSLTQADTVHQVVQAMRSGKFGPQFDKVFLGGHSVGSAVAIIEAGTYKDVDGVMVTGLTHGVNPLGAAGILASLVPAALDPKFAGKGLDIGYLTTRSNTRFASFHQPGAKNDGVVALDEETKDAFGPGEVVDTLLLGVLIPYTKAIKAPVFLVMGNDPAFCGFPAANCSSPLTLLQDESKYYSPAAQLETFVVSGYGHSLNFSPQAPKYHQAAIEWANKKIGR